MKALSIILLLFILQASSCNREEPVIIKNNEGVITSKAPNWSTSISDNNQYAAGVRNNIKYNTTVVIGSIENGKNGLSGINVTNGEKLWTWQDNFPNYTLDIVGSYTFNNNLIWDEGRNLYWVDLETGTTIWKKRYDLDEVPWLKNVNGLGESTFLNAVYSPYLVEDKPTFVKIYSVSTMSSELIELDSIGSDNPTINHDTSQIGVFKSANGDTLIFVDTYEVLIDGRTYLSLYNLSKKKWVYKKKETYLQAGVRARPKLFNEVVYFAADPFIVAVDLMSGEIVWKRAFDNASFFDSGFIIVPEKNLIVVNAMQSTTTLYALDLTTGQTVWSEPSSGTSSHLQYLNGVVYFVGGGDGLLHAVDIETGKHHWKISSPDLAVNSNAWFARYCAVFPGEDGKKGKVVVSSGLHAFAYEAER